MRNRRNRRIRRGGECGGEEDKEGEGREGEKEIKKENGKCLKIKSNIIQN